MKVKWPACAIALSLLSTGIARAQAISTDTESTPLQSIALARIVASLPAGYPWATMVVRRAGILAYECALPPDRTNTANWRGSPGPIDSRRFIPILAEELKQVGLKAADDPDDLFQNAKGQSDLLLGANIKDIKAELCARYHVEGGGYSLNGSGEFTLKEGKQFYDFDKSTGTIKFTIEWQLYSSSRRQTVYTENVQSTFSLTAHEVGNIDKFLDGGIRQSIKELVSKPAFREAVVKASGPGDMWPAKQAPLVLEGSKQAKDLKISDTVGSVVLVLSAGGHGSGFLVSSNGYVMTAAHVVGSDKYLKIKWSDGIEAVGEVIRTDRRRDVALIKSDPRGRQPLALRRVMPQPGDTVFAIGAPIDPKLQSTVTRGVASSNRIMDGFSFIQSDVTVDPGNSGGPLLDEKGQVLGFTDLGFRTADAPTGLNFFVPIDDALRFLSAEPH